MRAVLFTLLILAGSATSTRAEVGCCTGPTGNLDCDPGDVIDITDLTVLIDHLFISLTPLCCIESGNIDGDPGNIIDITDLTVLIDHLFISLGPTAPCQGLAALTVSPTNAMPGERLTITGYTIDTTQILLYSLTIGDQQTLVITDTAGGISTIAPVFFDDTTATWPTAPSEALDVRLYLDSVLVAVGESVFTLDSLTESPGSTELIFANTIATIESYKTILTVLPTEPGLQEQMSFALISALDSLLYARGDSSLTAVFAQLQSTSPEAVAFLDAIYGSSGADDKSQQIADAMAAIADSLSSGNFRRAAILPEDIRLAAMMQMSSMFKLYGDAFLHGAAESASDIAYVTGWLGMLNAIPGFAPVYVFASVTAAVTSLMDLVFNKVVVGTLPTILDSLTVDFASNRLSYGDTTISTLMVYARNNPPAITAGDLLSQFLSIAGLFVPSASSFEDQFLAFENFFLGQIKSALNVYFAAYPEFGYNPDIFDIFSVPIIKWEAEIQDPRLLELHTTSPNLLSITESTLEWYSSGDGGTAKVTITPGLGDDAVLIPIPPFLAYGGTAFGDLDDPASAQVSSTDTVYITAPLALEVDFPTTISQNGANALGVRAGTISLVGDTTWTAGLNVNLTAIGGGANPASGVTDSNGQFASVVSLNPFSDTVEVYVTVTDSIGSFSDTTVIAITEQISQKIVDVTLPPTIPVGIPTQAVIRAGIQTNGVTQYLQGVNISISMSDGEATLLSGITDASGAFNTMVTLLDGENQVRFNVTAIFPDFETANAEAIALRPNGIVLVGKSAKVSANWSINGSGTGNQANSVEFDTFDSTISISHLFSFINNTGLLSGDIDVTANNHSTVSINGTQSLDAQFDGMVSGQVTVQTGDSAYSVLGEGSASFRVRFEVWGEPAQYNLSIGNIAGQGYAINTPMVECNTGDSCGTISESGILEPGQRYVVNVSINGRGSFTAPMTGSQTPNASANLILSVHY